MFLTVLVLPCDCCGPPSVGMLCCLPCSIPKIDLTFTIKFYNYTSSTFPWSSTIISTKVVTLTYNNLGGAFLDTWTGSVPCPDGVSRTAKIHCEQFPTGDPYGNVFGTFPRCQTPYTLTSDGLFLLTRTANPPNNDGFSTYSCSPFSFHLEGFSDDGNGFNVVPTSYYDIAETSGDVYLGTCCRCQITVGGCNGGGIVPGATYSVWTDSGKASPIFSGVTNSSGYILFDAGFCGNGLYREITHPRFSTVAGSHTYVGTESDNLTTVVSGYHCSVACGTPVTNTLHSTHPKFGAITYTYSAGSWVGTASYSYPGNLGTGGTCTAKTITITCTWNGDQIYTESWKYDGSNCPDDAGANTATVTWATGTLVCPPSFSYGFTHTPAGAAEINLYGTGAMTNTLTE